MSRRWGTALALGLLAVAAVAGPAGGHGQKRHASEGRVEPVLDALPAPLAGLRVQLHETLAPQIVVAWDGDSPVEVLDDAGRAFLRIGPQGVEANLAAVAWYRTVTPSDMVPIPQEVLDADAGSTPPAPRWRRVRREPAWGWFDRRLDGEGLTGAAESSATLGDWRIPLRIDGVAHAIRGRFVHRPAPSGHLRLRLSGAGDLAPGVRVSLLSGRPGGLFLQNAGAEPVTVLGASGEPFLRLGPRGVEANRVSPTWRETQRLRGVEAGAAEEATDGVAVWERLSPSPRHGWIDPRTLLEPARVPAPVLRAGVPAEVVHWAIPLRIGRGDAERSVRIEGTTEWRPNVPAGLDRKNP